MKFRLAFNNVFLCAILRLKFRLAFNNVFLCAILRLKFRLAFNNVFLCAILRLKFRLAFNNTCAHHKPHSHACIASPLFHSMRRFSMSGCPGNLTRLKASEAGAGCGSGGSSAIQSWIVVAVEWSLSLCSLWCAVTCHVCVWVLHWCHARMPSGMAHWCF